MSRPVIDNMYFIADSLSGTTGNFKFYNPQTRRSTKYGTVSNSRCTVTLEPKQLNYKFDFTLKAMYQVVVKMHEIQEIMNAYSESTSE